MHAIRTVQWSPGQAAVRIIDQRRLPGAFVERDLATAEEVCEAIATLAVRGAPAIGICGAMGLCTALAPVASAGRDQFLGEAQRLAGVIARTRPTAVNLSWAVRRVLSRGLETAGAATAILSAMREEASAILDEDRRMCDQIGQLGRALLGDGARVLTHCNAGALATGGTGTALAPVYAAAARGQRVSVVATETRPLLQGSRLTAWELSRAGIPVTVVTDSAAAAHMRSGSVDLCLVGADRIVANGDVANKIGTYALAVLARHHGIPFYVAAPWSTVDASLASGDQVAIEQRDPAEVRAFDAAVAVDNPAFDITPSELITAIVTDRGIVRAPYRF